MGSNVLDSLEEVSVNGSLQWLYLRGRHRDNPVLLFLHGGPGSPMMPLARRFGGRLEEHFTVVHWDQRASGKSRRDQSADRDLTIRTYRDDTLCVVNLLRDRFAKSRIFLVGHSWGSILGVYAARDHPELFHAYVGMGQTVDPAEGERLSMAAVMEYARHSNNDEALAELAALRAPYIEDPSQLLVQRKWLAHYDASSHEYPMEEFARTIASSPEYSVRDVQAYWRGSFTLPMLTWPEVAAINFFVEAPRLDLPVYFFVGRHDHQVPFALVERYFEALRAPRKALIWFEDSAHMMHLTEPDRYQDALIDILRQTSDSSRERL